MTIHSIASLFGVDWVRDQDTGDYYAVLALDFDGHSYRLALSVEDTAYLVQELGPPEDFPSDNLDS